MHDLIERYCERVPPLHGKNTGGACPRHPIRGDRHDRDHRPPSRPGARRRGLRRGDREPAVPVRPGPGGGPQGRRRGAVRRHRQARRRRRVGHRARRTHRAGAGANRPPRRRLRHAPGDHLHPWRGLGLRQRPHPRPPGARTGGRRTGRRRLPRVRPLARGPLPRRHRAELHRGPVDSHRGRLPRPGRRPYRGGRRLRRRQHVRRAHPDGEGPRRRPPGPAGALLSGHRRRLRHRLLPPVRHRLLPAPRRHAVVLGPVHDRREAARRDHRVPLRATTEQLTGLPRPSSSPARPTSCATRARPTRPSSARRVYPSPPSGTRASSTTS